MSHTFISYSHDDDNFANRLARDLQDAGLDIWIDSKIGVGSAWIEAITDAIGACDFLIVCLTPSAVRSEWVRREVFTARAQHKRVLPLLVTKQGLGADGVTVLQTLDLLLNYDELRTLREIQMVDFERYGYATALTTLLGVLPNRSKPAPPADPTPDAARPESAPEPELAAEIDPATLPNPFKGLESFQQTDAHLFFGREALTDQLLARLNDKNVFIHLPVQTAFCPSPIGFIMCFLGSNLWILSLIPWIGE